MKFPWASMVVVATCVAGVWAQEADDTRVDYQPGASVAGEAQTQARMRSEKGRQLRQAALQSRQAYQAAVGRVPAIATLDQELATDHATLERLTLERKAVAEREASRCKLERDAWVDARDQLLKLRNDPQADPQAVEAARQQADATQKAFRQAMVTLPEVQDLDAQLAAVRNRLSQHYIARRAAEHVQADALAAERATMAADEKAYLDYVYGP